MMQGIIMLALATAAMVVRADGYYVYKDHHGNAWYTNRPMPGDQYELLATIGRPTAKSSCRGVTALMMKHRARAHEPIIATYAKLYGVNELLVKAIIRVESCFDTHAVSRVGAKGLMQLMPATAKRLGVSHIFNAKENIRGGIQYFHQMMERFNHDIKLALAAYNAGPKAVKQYGGIPPFKETRSYVRRVMDHYVQYASLSAGN